MIEINLKNKNALVCGASEGMGLATAKLLKQAGAKVTIISRSLDKLQKAAQETGADEFYSLDLSDLDAVKNFVKDKHDFHILVNNSAGPNPGSFLKAGDDEYLKAFTAHLLAANTLAKAIVPFMQKENYGRIINIISVTAKIPSENLAVSNTIRGAVLNWSKTLSNELAASAITVNNVLPGYTKTARLEAVMASNAANKNKSLEEISEEFTSKIPMKRFAEPVEIANAVLFLASPLARYITGQSLAVDGGRIPVS
ncbi:MAG: SDR family oxidoreductase [Candidatus Caenarcaniphilales bacterium]|jgi:3-oxoacyl-[acyl-carrier protein] reductase|nr:SDR family oxidoreductase [Candidatus Caenarcaniphilales bacterium]